MAERASLNWRPIDAAVLDGGFWLIAGSDIFAVARWNGTSWVHSSDVPIGFVPWRYHMAGCSTEAEVAA